MDCIYRRDIRNNRDRTRSYRQNTVRSLKAKYYVCQKESCRLWKYIEEERNRSRDKYKRRFNNNKGRNGNFKERFRQYTIYYKGDDNNEYNKTFEALVLNIDTNKNTNNNNSEEELEDPNGYYLILFGTLTIDEAISISVELANKAYAYLLTTISTEPTTETDPFNYNITTAALRYTSTVFMGIIINTSALKKSMAGYGQF